MSEVLFQQHKNLLDKALDVCEKRYSWTAFPESPSSRIHGKDIPARAKEQFDALLGQPFPLSMPGSEGLVGDEISPFTQASLGIQYPATQAEDLFEAANAARRGWAAASIEERVGVCLEMLVQLGQPSALFLNAHATVHTAGQGFIMAFAGCGANALDRGLESLAYAYKAMKDVPQAAHWERRFGAGPAAHLEKRYRVVPRGIGVVITCATFPQWNGYPAVMASLATGNPVIVKPHPNTILPVALFVKSMREVLTTAGHDPNLVTLAADTRSEPNTLELVHHRDAAIVDFTGGPVFGRWLEDNCPRAVVYTETAGCNSVVIESTSDFPAMCKAIAHSLCQASAQMCTSVQNIFVPSKGITAGDKQLTFEQVSNGIVEAVEKLISRPEVAAGLCGTLVDPGTPAMIEGMTARMESCGSVLRYSRPYEHPDYPAARTATPLIGCVAAEHADIYGQEHFGPVSFLIEADDAQHAVACATRDVRRHGAITSHVYSTDPEFLEQAESAYHEAGASVSLNLLGMPINFAAAYSDYHVTGLNPAGNACLADLAFVTNRFRIVQSRWPVATPASAEV